MNDVISYIPSRLKNSAIDPVTHKREPVAETKDIFDDELNKSQSEINKSIIGDKSYDPESYSGMGRIVLNKNIIDGVNILTQDMLNQENTIYVISYDFIVAEETAKILNFNSANVSALKTYEYWAVGYDRELLDAAIAGGVESEIAAATRVWENAKTDLSLIGNQEYEYWAEVVIEAGHVLYLEDRAVRLDNSKSYKLNDDRLIFAGDEDLTVYIGCLAGQRSFRYFKCLNIPNNSVLEFDGGSISNGYITFNDTLLAGDVKMDKVAAAGTIRNDYITPVDFGAKADGVTDDYIAFNSAVAVCDNVFVPNGTYLIDYSEEGRSVDITRSNVHITMNDGAVIKAAPCSNYNRGNGFRALFSVEGPGIVNNKDTRIENFTFEGGTIIGPRGSVTIPATGLTVGTILENGCGFVIRFCNNVTIKNCTITDHTGDAIYTAAVDNLLVYNVTTKRHRRASVSIGINKNSRIKDCNIDDKQYVLYDNGNSSYPCDPEGVICTEPEPSTLRGLTGAPIEDVIIEGCTIKSGQRGFLGCGINGIIRNNIFVNAHNFCISIIGSNNPSYEVGEWLVENNIFNGDFDYTQVDAGNGINFRFIGYGGTDIIIVRNNKANGACIYGDYEEQPYKKCIIENNYCDYKELAILHSSADNAEIIVKGNYGTCVAFAEWFGGKPSSLFIVEDNKFDGSAQHGRSSCFGRVENNCNCVVRNNTMKIGGVIIWKDFRLSGELIIEGNYIEMTAPTETLLFTNGNWSYIKADFINNYIKTVGHRSLSKNGGYNIAETGEFQYVMKVINNIFDGGEKRFTYDMQNTDHLIIKDNKYISIPTIGAFADAPRSYVGVGFEYFATDLKKFVYVAQYSLYQEIVTEWVDAIGNPVTAEYIQKSSTAGLVKNDGTIDTKEYLSKVSGATENNLVAFDDTGGIKDSGKNATDFTPATT